MLEPLYAGLHEELSIAITNTRGGKDAGRIAKHLIENDQSGTLLVGIVENASVLEYKPSAWTLRLVPINEDGRLDGMGASVIDRLESMKAVEAWLRENQGELLVWVHPRFRWVLEE